MKYSFITLIIILTLVQSHAQSLKVMTYNIRYDNPGDGVNQWSLRKHKVSSLIKKYDPDLIGIQEAPQHQLDDIIKDLPAYAYIGVGRDDGKTKGEFSAILYKKKKFKVKAQNTFWLSETPDVPGSKSWDAAITRVASWGEFQDLKTKKDFLFINTHFDHIGTEARKNSASLLKVKAAELRKKLPVIISGDFNCLREDAPYQVMMSKGDIELTDTAPANPPGTFCEFAVNSITCRPIDYIFISNEWTTKNYQVINDNDGKYYPSDHLPVMANIETK